MEEKEERNLVFVIAASCKWGYGKSSLLASEMIMLKYPDSSINFEEISPEKEANFEIFLNNQKIFSQADGDGLLKQENLDVLVERIKKHLE